MPMSVGPLNEPDGPPPPLADQRLTCDGVPCQNAAIEAVPEEPARAATVGAELSGPIPRLRGPSQTPPAYQASHRAALVPCQTTANCTCPPGTAHDAAAG